MDGGCATEEARVVEILCELNEQREREAILALIFENKIYNDISFSRFLARNQVDEISLFRIRLEEGIEVSGERIDNRHSMKRAKLRARK